jgi:hypothetical protein
VTREVCSTYVAFILFSDIVTGNFQWGGQNFTGDAINIRFNPHEGASDVPVLRAELRDDAGSYHEKDVNLAERINNYNGYLEFH